MIRWVEVHFRWLYCSPQLLECFAVSLSFFLLVIRELLGKRGRGVGGACCLGFACFRLLLLRWYLKRILRGYVCLCCFGIVSLRLSCLIMGLLLVFGHCC